MESKKRASVDGKSVEVEWKSPFFRGFSIGIADEAEEIPIHVRDLAWGREVRLAGLPPMVVKMLLGRFGSKVTISSIETGEALFSAVDKPTVRGLLLLFLLPLTVFFLLDPVFLIENRLDGSPISVLAAGIWLLAGGAALLSLRPHRLLLVVLCIGAILGYSRFAVLLYKEFESVLESGCLLCPVFVIPGVLFAVGLVGDLTE